MRSMVDEKNPIDITKNVFSYTKLPGKQGLGSNLFIDEF